MPVSKPNYIIISKIYTIHYIKEHNHKMFILLIRPAGFQLVWESIQVMT